jgi:hypothetical protein
MSSVVEVMLKNKNLEHVHVDKSKVIASYLFSHPTKFPKWVNEKEVKDELEKIASELAEYFSVYTSLLLAEPKDEHRLYKIKNLLIEYCAGAGTKGTPWHVVRFNLLNIELVDSIQVYKEWTINNPKLCYVGCKYNLDTRLSPKECRNFSARLKEVAEKILGQSFVCSVSDYFTKHYPGIHLQPCKNTEILIGLPFKKTSLDILLYLEGMLQSFDVETGKFEVRKIRNFPVYETPWE